MTPRKKGYGEDELVEQPAIALFEALGWEVARCIDEFAAGKSPLGRDDKGEVVLLARLRAALEHLNPDLPAVALQQAIDELTRDRSALSLVQANREVYALLKNGVPVRIPDAEGEERDEVVRVIDWERPDANDFLLCSQFWVTGDVYTRRADLVGFVNGLPLVFVELKATHRRLRDAYDRNLRDYKSTVPKLFWYNGLLLLSNGSQSRAGSITAGWEHFAEWKRVDDEHEPPAVSLETILRATCDPARLLDLVENFTLFQDVRGGTIKLLAKNHQYLGVNNALRATRGLKRKGGRLGVFWHTQGSGKSVSMIFFSQKVLRKQPGAWTFVVVTDRQELDEQIYKEFARSGAITEPEAQAESAVHLRQHLGEDHRYVFTLIHKFRTEGGAKHPVVSERRDIIVIADEAHRTQYDTLARNMRTALPNAAFIAFTGTPLIAGEERTREVFGDYVSIYNFKQSMDDRNTVPLYYDNRIPELQLTNDQLNEEIYQVVEDAGLDEAQEARLEREFARDYHLITRGDRLERIAADIVTHCLGRGFLGKAMVVCIDKATAIRMYDKVQRHWREELERVARELDQATGSEREKLEERARYLRETDMAVVISQAQNEVEDMRARGLDITVHRRRMMSEDLDERFKDPDNPFRIVFVCAMWMTGFDVPSCSTIYVDKPLRRHTLMQTIARANRVFPRKENGLIVDYVGVFRDLERALAVYGSGSGGGVRPGEWPVEDKEALREHLKRSLEAARAFCTAHLIDLDAIYAAYGLERIRRLDDAVEALLVNDETKQEFLNHANTVARLYKALLPDPTANDLAPACTALGVLAEKLRSLVPPADISGVMSAVEAVLDRSIAAEGYVIEESPDRIIDLSNLNLAALERSFARGRKRTHAERLRSAIKTRVEHLIRLNRTRTDYLERFQALIDAYNTDAINVQVFFDRLVQFTRELSQEEQRAMTEGLSEEELAIFDLLTKPNLWLTKKQRDQVKGIARDLLDTLKRQRLVLDWRKRQQSRAAVRLAIEETLDQLPDPFTPDIYGGKCEAIYQHIYDSYASPDENIYAAANE
jgi:type I restriction enzyme R subunit